MSKRINGTAILGKPLILSLYRNGLKFGNLPYYPYFCTECQEMLSDLWDGFFPTKLKGKVIECTPIFLEDLTDQLYIPEAKKIMQKTHLELSIS